MSPAGAGTRSRRSCWWTGSGHRNVARSLTEYMSKEVEAFVPSPTRATARSAPSWRIGRCPCPGQPGRLPSPSIVRLVATDGSPFGPSSELSTTFSVNVDPSSWTVCGPAVRFAELMAATRHATSPEAHGNTVASAGSDTSRISATWTTARAVNCRVRQWARIVCDGFFIGCVSRSCAVYVPRNASPY